MTSAAATRELDSVEGGCSPPRRSRFNDVSAATLATGVRRDVTYDLTAASWTLLDVTNTDDGSSAMISGKVNEVRRRPSMTCRSIRQPIPRWRCRTA
jgi:hypothetical protein